jgi:hypothetical protein
MNNTERPIQYGLGGDFGGPQPVRGIEEVAQEKTQSKEDREKIVRRRVVPKGTLIYIAGQRDYSYTTTDSFYVLIPKKDKRSTVKTVKLEASQISVYRDGRHYNWVSDSDLITEKNQYVPLIEVHSNRLIDPNKKKK